MVYSACPSNIFNGLLNNFIEESVVDSFLQELVSDAGQLRNGEITVLRLEIVFRQAQAGIHAITCVVFMNDKVGNRAFHM